MKLKLTPAITLASVTLASAHIVTIGTVALTGTFTLNHLFNFNDPAAQPFGTFSDQVVTSSSGIFSPFVQAGEVLPSQPLWTANNLPLFSLGGFTFTTGFVGISGADSGRFVGGFVNLTGNGYQFDPDNRIVSSFIAPPHDISNFPEDITGPITFRFAASHDNHWVPDGGLTIGLFFLGLMGLLGFKR